MEEQDAEELKREIEKLKREMEIKQRLLKKMDERKKQTTIKESQDEKKLKCNDKELEELIGNEQLPSSKSSSRNSSRHQSQETIHRPISGSGDDNNAKTTKKKPVANCVLDIASTSKNKNTTTSSPMDSQSSGISLSHGNNCPKEMKEDACNVTGLVSSPHCNSNSGDEDRNKVDDKEWKRIIIGLEAEKSTPILFIHSFHIEDKEQLHSQAFCTVTMTQLTFWFSQKGCWEDRSTKLKKLEKDVTDRVVPLQSTSSTKFALAFVLPHGDEHAVWIYTTSYGSHEIQEKFIYNTRVNFRGESSLHVFNEDTLVLAIKNEAKTVPVKISFSKDLDCAESTLNLVTANEKLTSFFPVVKEPQHVAGFATAHLFIWDHVTGQMMHRVQLGEEVGERVWLATEEEGFIFLLTSDRRKAQHVASVVAVSPKRSEFEICYSMKLSAIAETETDGPSWIKEMSQQRHLLSVLTDSGNIYVWDVLTSELVTKVGPATRERSAFHLNRSLGTLVVGHSTGNADVYARY